MRSLHTYVTEVFFYCKFLSHKQQMASYARRPLPACTVLNNIQLNYLCKNRKKNIKHILIRLIINMDFEETASPL